MGLAVSANAALAPSMFEELDGNMTVQGVGAKDWATAPNLVPGDDLPTGQSDDSLGKGSKENSPVPKVVDGSIPNNKSDLTRFYVANEKTGGVDFLYLAWERASTLGTANMDFEFNQSDTPTANGITPERTGGDILVTFDFSSGGNVVDLGLLRWVTSGSRASALAAPAPLLGQPGGPRRGRLRQRLGELRHDRRGDRRRHPGRQDVRRGRHQPDRRRLFGAASCTTFGSAYLKSRSSDSSRPS